MTPEEIENWDCWEYELLDHPKCPNCDKEVSDHHNGGDPNAWWNADNIPDAQFKHKCICGQVFRIQSSWSPKFDVIPIEIDDYYTPEEYESLEEV